MSQKEKGLPVTSCVLALREQLNVHNAPFCVKRFRDNVDRFRNVSAHELYCLNAFQISKGHAHSHELDSK